MGETKRAQELRVDQVCASERLTRKQKTSRPDEVWSDMWKFVSNPAMKKAKQRWAIEKPKLDNARQLRGIYFSEKDDEEFKLIIKAARRKLEVPMPAAMPCKIPIKSSGETHRNIGKRMTKYACTVDADESTDEFFYSLKSVYKLREKDKATFYVPSRNGYSGLRQQKSRRKESLQLIQERVCIWSVRKTFTLLSWRP